MGINASICDRLPLLVVSLEWQPLELFRVLCANVSDVVHPVTYEPTLSLV